MVISSGGGEQGVTLSTAALEPFPGAVITDKSAAFEDAFDWLELPQEQRGSFSAWRGTRTLQRFTAPAVGSIYRLDAAR